MIIITKKVRRGRLAAGCLILVLAIGVVGAGLGLVRDIRETQAVSVVHQGAKGVRNNETRIAFLEGFGWVVGPEAASVEEVQIPDTFDSSYDEYLALQESQGFHLKDYAGKKVKRYTYEVRNFPGLQEGIWASILVYHKEVVGGEVFCSQGDGFMQGLAYPIETKQDGKASNAVTEDAQAGTDPAGAVTEDTQAGTDPAGAEGAGAVASDPSADASTDDATDAPADAPADTTANVDYT